MPNEDNYKLIRKKIMSYLVFSQDDNNCKLVGSQDREAKYKTQDIKLKYIGEREHKKYKSSFDSQ